MEPSPFAPATPAQLQALAALRFSSCASGVKANGRPDLLLVALAEGTRVAGRFTTSQTVAAPVRHAKRVCERGYARALLVNSGNANAFTGRAGELAVEHCAARVAERLGVSPEEVIIASTGVIGEPLPLEKLLAGIDLCAAKLSPESSWLEAAEAISTTDTFPKLARAEHSEGVFAQGIAKGSGMISPHLATMLAFLFLEGAQLSAAELASALADASATSFEAITVDGDCSTNDSVVAFALPGPGPGPGRGAGPEVLGALCAELAEQVVSDGEGISKRFDVSVRGAADVASAKQVALAIANSPLVKTAMAGQDANWGRVVMAIGKSGVTVDQNALRIAFGEHLVAEAGARAASYDEAQVSAYLKAPRVVIHVDLALGEAAFRVMASDLTHGYIRINADYRS